MSETAGGMARAGDNVTRGIVLTVTAVLIFGIQDAAAKVVVQDYSPFQITMMRYWAFAAFSLFLVMRRAPLRQALKSRFPMLQLIRGLLLILDIWFFAFAVKTVPLGELQSISLIYPLVVTIVAIPVLGEKVGIFRFAAVGVGFLGAMIIVRPGQATAMSSSWIGFEYLSGPWRTKEVPWCQMVGMPSASALRNMGRCFGSCGSKFW